MKNNGNVIIIGSGPAGVSAALYTIRAGIETTVISDGEGSLKKAEKIENYYGFSDPITGDELEASAIKGAKRLGVKFVDDEVVGLKYVDSHVVQTIKNEYPADSVIIATGSTRKVPKILGLIEHEGKGVSYCAVCDAFFYRNKNVGVLGFGEYAVHEAMELLPVVNSVTILTNGEKLTAKVSDDIQINTKKILSINGEDRLSSVSFEGSEELPLDGVFVAYGTAGSLELARK
ncbi:MAG: NAD(P)/FAD-dependent oxidoreductase, partial [Oscillospiraceae bacterium]